MTITQPIFHRNFTAVEAASYVRVSRATLYKLIRTKRLTPVKIGRRTLFTREDLDRLIDDARAA